MISVNQIEDLGIKNWASLFKRFNNADILLGNGFSINLAGHFNYKSLFEEFLKNCKPKERAIFQNFNKHHFELIQESLISAKNVTNWLDIEDTDKKIDNAINALKNGLIKSIGKTHPKAVDIDFNQLKSLSLQLNNFNDIYTLNYDLFLYHIIMQMKDEAERQGADMPYSDYFWGGELTDQYKYFMDFDENHEKHIYYLHGALFIFKKPPNTCKLKRSSEPEELVTMIGNLISKGRMPLFVSEGLSREKLKFIEKSGYLGFCYKNFKESKHKLVVYGTSFSSYDTHITNAIKQSKPRRELAISIYINDKTKYDLKEEINHLIKKFKYHKISFFDSRTIFKF